MPTVEQVWRQAMPLGANLIAGEGGVYNEVSWVVSLKPTPPVFDRLRGNELALIDIQTAKGLGVGLTSLITSLSEQGASALGILGEVPPQDRELANGRKTPIIQLPPGSDLSALEAQIIAFIREERPRLYQREQELTQKVMELALTGRGVDAILHKLQGLTGRKIILLSPDFEPHAMPTELKLPGIQEKLIRLFRSPPSSITGLKPADGLAGFLSPVSGKEGVDGYLLVIAPSADLQELDRLTAKVGALALAIETSRRQAVEDTEDKFQAEMVESLLSGDLTVKAVNERAARLGLDLSRSYIAMAVQSSGSSYKASVIARKASTLFSQALCHTRSDTLIIFYPAATNASFVDLRRLGKEVTQKLSASLGTKISLGVGRAYTGPEGLRTSFQEAERSLAVGKRLFGEGSTSFFWDLGVYRLLLSIGLDELKSFYQDSIGMLAEYDRQHEGELLHTLEATLYHPTLSETAKVLHVHRNTLLYRLERIQEITNLNLDNGDTRLALHLALKAGEVIRAS